MTTNLNAVKQALQQRDFQQALTLAETLQNDPVQAADALYFAAVAQRYLQQPQQALTTLNKLLQLAPDYARGYQERGYCHKALGNQLDAAKGFFDATTQNPALIASWQQLVVLYQQLGQAEGQAFAEQQLIYWSSMPRPVLGAAELLHDGNVELAEQVCRQFLQQHKHHIDAMYVLAQIGIALKVFDDAEFLLESCVELAPEHVRARAEYASLLNKIGKYAQALSHAEHLLKTQPDNLNYQVIATVAQMGLGHLSDAIQGFEKVLAREPGRTSVQLQLGHACKSAGKRDHAIAAYRAAYQQKPDFGDAYWSLANTKTYRFTDSEIQQMQAQVEHPATTSEDRIHLCFALGKAFEDQKAFAQSFAFYAKGNDLKYQQLSYSPEAFSTQVDAQISECTEAFFTERQGWGESDPAPIFILGLPRAGSTLLEQILASHSQVDATQELHQILSLARRLRGRNPNPGCGYPHNLKELTAEQIQAFGLRFIQDTQHFRQGAPFFIDKMPNNFQHIGLIKLILPNAKIIDARRDPMDCCFSGYKQLFGEGQDFTYNLTALGRYYRDYERLMQHWDAVLPGFVLRVQHEDVLDDLDGQVRRILDFCGLPFEPACLDFHKTERAVQTPSAEQVRQPINRQGVGRWKPFEAELGELKLALGFTD